MSLINLKGENFTDLKDILQIVVLCFLRMKVSHNKIGAEKVQNTCMFLHQNVSAINAHEKNEAGLQKIVSTLDAATMEAAESESIQDVKTFNQVLKFDTNKHVKYFPGLWKGATLMAPVDPTYSKKAEEAKEIMFTTLQSGLPSLTMHEIFDNINLLWDGILSENFIFNTLYMKAYDELEKYFRKMLNCVQDKIIKLRRTKEPKLNKADEERVDELCK